jgi:hypothetical protein
MRALIVADAHGRRRVAPSASHPIPYASTYQPRSARTTVIGTRRS